MTDNRSFYAETVAEQQAAGIVHDPSPRGVPAPRVALLQALLAVEGIPISEEQAARVLASLG
ncbi:hypothetical protein DFLDMN_000711 [Cupriavidus sp. H19C3]|uniref:hypothetical protein n=1 Tax=Cupriavidus sp. H19C3 TaxID=3241603 RepID=UPI003BF8720D